MAYGTDYANTLKGALAYAIDQHDFWHREGVETTPQWAKDLAFGNVQAYRAVIKQITGLRIENDRAGVQSVLGSMR